MGRPTLLADVVSVFLTDAPNMLERLRAAGRARDANGVAAAAHAIKGAAGLFSQGGAFESAARLEQPAAPVMCRPSGKQLLFVDASFQLNPGEKVGLVGPNGSGKTTLFRMIVGEESPDDGDVTMPKKLSVGYFRQDIEEMSGRSVLDEVIAGSGRPGTLHHELEDLQRAMADPARASEMDRILARFGEVQEEYEHLGGYAPREPGARGVARPGLRRRIDRRGCRRAVRRLEDARGHGARAARPARRAPDGRADQPSRHRVHRVARDVPQIAARRRCSMTSHDRDFMNRVVTRDRGDRRRRDHGLLGQLRLLRAGAARCARPTARRAYARQQAMLAKEQRFIDRFARHAAKAAQVQSRVKALEKIEKIELPKKRRVVKFEFRPPPRSGDEVVVLEGVSKRYGSRSSTTTSSLTVQRGERWSVMGGTARARRRCSR